MKTKNFVINLKRNPERRKSIRELFNKVGIDFEFVDAVDGNMIRPDQIKNIYSERLALKELKRKMALTEIGCSLSHIKIWKRIVGEGLEGAFIFEDDIYINEKCKNIMNKITELHSIKEKSVVLLTYVSRYSLWDKIFKFSVDSSLYKISRNMKYNPPVFAHGYYITRSAAISLINDNKPITMPIDNWGIYLDRKLIDLYNVVPYCVGHSDHSKNSNIQPERESIVKHYNSDKEGFIYRYLYRKFIYQIFVRPIFLLRKQSNDW